MKIFICSLTLKKIYKVIITIALIICILIVFFLGFGRVVKTSVATTGKNDIYIIIDAGHGGIDGGASSADGTPEKGINLDIALKLRDYLTVAGFNTIMIREEDISLHEDDASTIKQQKRSDLKARLEIADKNPDAIYISIHLNHFPNKRAKGAQVFYSPNNENSKLLGEVTQETLTQILDKNNNRLCKESYDTIYIMKNIKNPAIIIECGFLSNPQETDLLKTPEYQNKISYTICMSLIKYINQSSEV